MRPAHDQAKIGHLSSLPNLSTKSPTYTYSGPGLTPQHNDPERAYCLHAGRYTSMGPEPTQVRLCTEKRRLWRNWTAPLYYFNGASNPTSQWQQASLCTS